MQPLEMPAFTVREAAKYIGVERETLYTWVHKGRVAAELDVAGQLRIPYGEVWRLLKERERV